MIKHAMICNDEIFKGVSKTLKEVEEKSFLVGKWFLDRAEVNSCAFSYWL